MTRRTTETSGYTRTVLPPLRHEWNSQTVMWRRLSLLGGDELRVRAFLWRVLGVGAAATGRQQ
ncbi:hypothetical protein OG352_39770 (plasmid) [Streptomyces sp. NBC_01485]|uniref:hypothetical protein n=1 Tax=Streptomyces sp. NBC_01485 TaxID=2903884 RepID=UPI002E33DE4A|nr:hypothetical protein [Streptomyces sp. NBC_01485]